MLNKLKQLIPKKLRSKFTNRPILQKIVKNIGWLSGERILELLVALTVGIWVARYLGPSDYGLLNYAIAFVTLFTPFIGLGVKNILVRELVDKPELKDKLMGTTFWITLITSIITGFFIISFAFLITPEDIVLLQIITIFAIGNIINSFTIITSYFESKIESNKLVKARSITLVINSILKIYLILFNFSVLFFAIIGIIDVIILSSSLIFLYNKDKQSIFNWKFDFFQVKRLLILSWPLVFSAVFATIYLRIDQVMIGLMLSSEEVGFYSVAVHLSEVGYFLPGVIAMSLFPILMSTKKNSKEKYFSRLQKMFDYFTWGSIIMIIPIFFLSSIAIEFLYGVEFASAGIVLSMLIWTLLSQFVRFGVINFLTTEELYKISLYTSIIGAVINVIANLILIPIYGIIGAAFATVISYFFVAYFGNLLFKKTRFLLWMQLKSFNLVRILKE